MKEGDRVQTEYGSGTMIEREAEEGQLSKSILVRLDSIDTLEGGLVGMHKMYGGLYFYEDELTSIKGDKHE